MNNLSPKTRLLHPVALYTPARLLHPHGNYAPLEFPVTLRAGGSNESVTFDFGKEVGGYTTVNFGSATARAPRRPPPPPPPPPPPRPIARTCPHSLGCVSSRRLGPWNLGVSLAYCAPKCVLHQCAQHPTAPRGALASPRAHCRPAPRRASPGARALSTWCGGGHRRPYTAHAILAAVAPLI